MVTTFDPGRMIWHGYTGAAGWMFRQAIEGVMGYRLVGGLVVPPGDPEASPIKLGEVRVSRHVESSPMPGIRGARAAKKPVEADWPGLPT